MESTPSAGDSFRGRYHAINAERPTVILFSGLPQNKDGSREEIEQPAMVFAKSSHENLHDARRNCSIDSEESGSEDGEQYRGNEQGRTYFQSPDTRCNEKPRQRTSFTKFQRIRLEEEFKRDAYIIGMKRWRLSEELDVPEKKIKIWFQNRRTKMKKGY